MTHKIHLFLWVSHRLLIQYQAQSMLQNDCWCTEFPVSSFRVESISVYCYKSVDLSVAKNYLGYRSELALFINCIWNHFLNWPWVNRKCVKLHNWSDMNFDMIFISRTFQVCVKSFTERIQLNKLLHIGVKKTHTYLSLNSMLHGD